jgi:hypothetical protein
MMRAFGNRPGCVVVDEPFYACYLAATGIDHPMREAVIASQSTDWQTVAGELVSGRADSALFYQKHMTHHMLPEVDLGWTRHLLHCFLIRDPFEVVNSYVAKRAEVTTEDIGVIRQLELYEEISAISGQDIPVIDGRDVLLNPRQVLNRLCEELSLPFSDAMLNWPKGRRSSDGVWADHWYGSVEQSTCFESYRERAINLTISQRRVAEESMVAYEVLSQRRIH